MGGGEVLKKGWLVKSPPLEGGGMKSWRKRFFVLRSSKIMEYSKAENGEIKGVVNLEDCVSVHADLFHKKYKHVFDIQTKDRTYFLVAPTTEEMTSWVTALCDLCGFTSQEMPKLNRRSSSTLPSNISVVMTPLPYPPPPPSSLNSTGAHFSPEVEKYLLSPEVVQLLRNKPRDSTIPSGTPLQDALVQKGLSNHARTISYTNSVRSSTGSSIDSPAMSQRSSQDPEYFSRFSSSSSTDGQSDTSSFTYDIPTNNQPAHTRHTSINVPSHYDVPRSSVSLVDGMPLDGRSFDRAQLLSNHYMVPRSLIRASDPLLNYDYLPPPRPVSDEVKRAYDTYDYPPRRDIPLPPRTDVPPPPLSNYDYPPKRDLLLPRRSDVSLTYDHIPQEDIPLPRSNVSLPLQTANNIYDVPPHPRPLHPCPSDVYDVPPPPGTLDEHDASTPVIEQDPPFPVPPPPTEGESSPRRLADSTDCPVDLPPPQGNVPPPPILFRRESRGSEDEMIPNKMYDMVLPNGGLPFGENPLHQKNEKEELEETLTHEIPKENEEVESSASSPPQTQQYVNLCTMEEEDVPPPIDRSLKPGGPPRIDRSSKPRANQDGDNDLAMESSKSFSESPPASSRSGSVQEEAFSPREVPRLTSHSVHYTQVTFDRKKPVPTPRLSRTPNSSPPQRRVNYSDIDIDAINDLSLSNGSYQKSGDEYFLEHET